MPTCDILIIDDDEDDVEILSTAFSKSGVRSVHYVYSAMQAFIYLQQITDKEDLPKLIVSDLYLPGMTGAEFAADLKAMPFYRHVPVIILSTIKSEREIERYRQMGIDEYFQKPSTYNEYLDVARQIKERFV